MEEDDLDFTPISTTSSNLASLFGFNKEPTKGNPSLTYTAPKAPKKESSPMKKQPTKERSGKVMISKAVQAYKLENRAYVSQGLTGVAIYGNQDLNHYEIILYKPSKEQISDTTITRNFSLTLSPNNYVSFYDNNKQNWSIMFQCLEDLAQIAQTIAFCKFFSESEPPENILFQDLTFSTNPQANMESTVEIVYNSQRLKYHNIRSTIEFEIKEKLKLSNYSFTPLSKGLIGCHEGSRRVIIVPHSLSGRYLNKLRDKEHLTLEVKLEKIISESEEKLLTKSTVFEDGQESSSAEESIIKSRGASIKEALTTTKSQKANLISRMARMGQATLPLKQSLASGPSDSEEEGLLSSPPKPRMTRSRVSNSVSIQNTSFLPQPQPESQQLAVYQNDLALQQSQLAKQEMTYQHRMAVSASPISSPTTDPNFSVYVSESRVQAAELRMGMCKISEKLDSVWNKLQNMHSAENKTQHPALLDSSGILTSIQSLISENESLKGKVEEQKEKIEQQSDRIFQLLELNHKYLEQSSTSLQNQSESENKLKTELQCLREKESQLEADKEKAEERVGHLEKNLASAEEAKKKLNERIERLSEEVGKFKSNLDRNDGAREKETQNWKEKISKASETISNLKEKLKEVVLENEVLKSVIKNQKEEVQTARAETKDSIMKNEKYEREMENLKKQISPGESKSGTKIDDLFKVGVLEEENHRLLTKSKKEIEDTTLKFANILKDKFIDSKDYSGSMILTTIYKCYKELTGCSIPNEKPLDRKETKENAQAIAEKPSEKAAVLPAPRTSLQKTDVVKKENDITKSSESKSVDSPDAEKKEDFEKSESGKTESDSRYKSYDQGWRTTKPPPPSLFDDDDDDDIIDWLN